MHIAFLNPQGNFDADNRYLTEHPDFGGQLVYVREVALALADLGVSVDVVTRRIDDPAWPGFDAPLDDFGVHQDRVRIVRLDAGGLGFLPKERLWPHLPALVEQMDRFYQGQPQRPDAVTTHYADGGWMGVLWRQRTATPFTFTGHSLGAQKLERLGADRARWPELNQRFEFNARIAAERATMAHAGAIITSTRAEQLEQYAHPLYADALDAASDPRFRLVPPGINESIFNTDTACDDVVFRTGLAERCGNDSRPVVLASSRLEVKKNLAGFVEAWLASAELRQRARLALFVRGLDRPFDQLDRLGKDEQAVLGPLLKRIEAEGLRDEVVFVNAGSQRQLATAYRWFAQRGSVFVLPSLYEPFGLAPIEAAACGLAVVATRFGGPSEVFSAATGVLVDPSDPAAMANALLDALSRQPDLARAAADMVRERYTWSATARGYLDTLETLVASGASPLETVPSLEAGAVIESWLPGPGSA
ncbi:MAG: glycosyltransferase [Wenzhouxiangella sp.]